MRRLTYVLEALTMLPTTSFQDVNRPRVVVKVAADVRRARSTRRI
jgi:hypothetical protein